MKKKILSFCLAFAVIVPAIFLLSACGDKTPQKVLSYMEFINENGSEIYDLGHYEYSNYLDINPTENLYLKLSYSDGSTEIIKFGDSKLNVTYKYADSFNTIEETLTSLPSSTEYKVGNYYVFVKYDKQEINIPFFIEKAKSGLEYTFAFSDDFIGWDYVNFPSCDELYDYIEIKENNQIVNADISNIYYITKDEFNELKSNLGIEDTNNSLPNTEEIQQALTDLCTDTYSGYYPINPGEYVFFVKINESDNYFSQYITVGAPITIQKTKLFISNDTKDLDYATIDLRYTSLDEIKNGILLDEFNSYSYTNNNIVITDEHNNTFYNIDDFQFTDWIWETEGSTPKYVNYKTDDNSSYEIGINFTGSIPTDDQVYYDSEGFDFSELFVKVKLNIGYVSISLNTGTLLNLSAAEYRLNKNSLYLNIEVKSISDNFQEYLTDLNTNDLLELLNISIKNITTDTVLLASDYNLVNSSQLYHYINLNEDVIMPAVYKVIVQNLNPNSSIITEQNMSFEFSAASLYLEDVNNVVVQPDGSITAQVYLYTNKGTSYPTNVFESNNNTLTAQLLETDESGEMSTVELNNINVSYEIKLDDEIQKTAIIITANLSTVSDSYYTAVLHIQARSDNLDYNNIDAEISFAISKYNLTDNDYIKGTDGSTIYNGKEGTHKLSYDLSEGESLKFSDIFDMSTVNNMYGSWKLQQYQGGETYEDINFDTAITKSNLSFRLVFVPKVEDYCEIPNDIDIILELNINTNV